MNKRERKWTPAVGRGDLPPEERFMLQITKDDETDCWIWTGALYRGYGRFRVNGVRLTTARWSYQQWNGAIPDGYSVLHTCGDRRCVNPAHLDLVTEKGQPWPLTGASVSTVTHCQNGHSLEEVEPSETGFKRCPICKMERARRERARIAARYTS